MSVSTPSIGQEHSDCNLALDFGIDDTLLTRTELIAMMDERFYESLAEYQDCFGGGSQSQSNGSGGAAGATGDGQNTSNFESVATTEVQGTETASISEDNSEILDQLQAENLQASTEEQQENIPNGRVPADIPLGDNDNALAAQIRLAAENETDPSARAELWNEYRRFKGLPLKQD